MIWKIKAPVPGESLVKDFDRSVKILYTLGDHLYIDVGPAGDKSTVTITTIGTGWDVFNLSPIGCYQCDEFIWHICAEVS